MKKRICALLFVSLTLVTMGVGVFAQQPNVITPAVDYLGYWQNTPSNIGYPSSWTFDICPECGQELYSMSLNGLAPTPLSDGAIISLCIANPTAINGSTVADMGILFSNSHNYGDHINGRIYYIGNTIYTKIAKSDGTIPMVWQICPTDSLNYDNALTFLNSYVVGRDMAYARSFGIFSIQMPYYIDSVIDEAVSASYSNGYNDGYYSEGSSYNTGYHNGYADGQINATKNVSIIGMVDEIMNGIANSLNPILSFEILGVSALSLAGLMCTLFVVLLIIKVVRS